LLHHHLQVLRTEVARARLRGRLFAGDAFGTLGVRFTLDARQRHQRCVPTLEYQPRRDNRRHHC
jgi:hypothetical protein